MSHELDAVYARVPWLAGAGEPQRLAGLTNVNYRLGPYVVRLPGAGTHEYIDRVAEERAARAAADAGVSVEVLFFDTSDGLMVTRFLEGAATMSAEAFRADDGAVERAADVMRRLHTGAAPFAVEFHLFEATAPCSTPSGRRCPTASPPSARRPSVLAGPWPPTRWPTYPATAIRCARTSSTTAHGCA